MKTNRHLIINISLAILSASLCLYFSRTPFFWSLESLSLDLLFRVRSAQTAPRQDKNIVIIEVTDADLVRSGVWPWPRARYREMCELLSDLGAKQIFFDYLFPIPDELGQDDDFARVIKSSGNVYFPYIFTSKDLTSSQITAPVPALANAARGLGASIIFPDMDGKWRRLPLLFDQNGNQYEHIALRMARDDLGMNIKTLTPHHLVLTNGTDDVRIPLLEGHKMLLNWHGTWSETFHHYDFLELVQAYHDQKNQKIPAIDLAGIKGKICLVGVTATGLYDNKITPLEASFPGVGVIATALGNINNRDFLYVLPFWTWALIVYALILLLPFSIFSGSANREGPFLLLLASVIILSYIAFLNGIVFNPSVPLIALLTGYFFISLMNSTRMTVEKKLLLAMATTDGMTGLYNFRYLKEALGEECHRVHTGQATPFCVLICDIDHFKKLNDNFGHQTGDLVLKNAAAILKNSVRGGDLVARYGGDELLVLLRNIPLESACVVAEKIRANIADMELSCHGQRLEVTVSLGVAQFKPGADDPARLIENADKCLYFAKENGRNRVCS